MRIVCISDTHNHRPEIPEGDLLIHAGDHSYNGTSKEILDSFVWLGDQKHRHKVTIAGNHDRWLASLDVGQELAIEQTGVHYLRDSFIELEGLLIYGSPWTLPFGNWSFMATEGEIRKKLLHAPYCPDIVVSHGPPYKILDATQRGEHAGSQALLAYCESTKPKLVVFGHIHEAKGKDTGNMYHGIPTYINCAYESWGSVGKGGIQVVDL